MKTYPTILYRGSLRLPGVGRILGSDMQTLSYSTYRKAETSGFWVFSQSDQPKPRVLVIPTANG